MKIPALVLALAALLLLPAITQARAPRYYVSLGDSLSIGYQPRPDGTAFATRQGYVDDLFKTERHRFRGLRMQKFGCGGETSVSILTDPANCSYGPYRSQLDAALAFLRAHRGEIAFVTIDIGANDVQSCAKNGGVDLACVTRGSAAVTHNLPIVARRLRQAAGKPTTIAGMTYYDPFLQYYLLGGTSRGLSNLSIGLATQINDLIAAAYRRQHIAVADVAAAYQTAATTPMVDLPGFGSVPLNVARICQLTWMCSPPPIGQNIHAKTAGYRLIAQTFARVIR